MKQRPLTRLWAIALLTTGCTSTPPNAPAGSGEASFFAEAPAPSSRTSAYQVPAAKPSTVFCLQDIHGDGTSGEGARKVQFHFTATALSDGPPTGRLEVRLGEAARPFAGAITEFNASSQGFSLSGHFDGGADFTVALPLRSASAPPDRFVLGLIEDGGVTAYGSLEPVEGRIDFGMCGSGI